MMKIVLELRYIASEKNKLCKDTGDVPVIDLKTCKSEDLAFKMKVNGMDTIIPDHDLFQETNPDRPSGCYLIPFDDHSAAYRYFNHHIDGKPYVLSQQVCLDRGR